MCNGLLKQNEETKEDSRYGLNAKWHAGCGQYPVRRLILIETGPVFRGVDSHIALNPVFGEVISFQFLLSMTSLYIIRDPMHH